MENCLILMVLHFFMLQICITVFFFLLCLILNNYSKVTKNTINYGNRKHVCV